MPAPAASHSQYTAPESTAFSPRVHGGGAQYTRRIAHDFSTNTNTLGPCPHTVTALQQVSAHQLHSYPDPHYHQLCEQLAQWHGVAHERIVIAASGSEAITRITQAFAHLAQERGEASHVQIPKHAYGDYAHHARLHQLAVHSDEHSDAQDLTLRWFAYPSSPLGQCPAQLPTLGAQHIGVLDCAYAPLQISGRRIVPSATTPPSTPHKLDHWWQLWTPNKALGMCGMRAAYLIAPKNGAHHVRLMHLLNACAPSWPLGAHGVALLQSWATDTTQDWINDSLEKLAVWKRAQQDALNQLGWTSLYSSTSFFCAIAPSGLRMPHIQQRLLDAGIVVRDCTSFGLRDTMRINVTPPSVFTQLRSALHTIGGDTVS